MRIQLHNGYIMGKHFGTDGFRGEAGITLTADHAYKVSHFLGWYYNALRERNGNNEPARIVVGKDNIYRSHASAWLCCSYMLPLRGEQ